MFTLNTPQRVEHDFAEWCDYIQAWARLNSNKHERRPMRSAVVAMINYAHDIGHQSSTHRFDLIAY